MLLLAHWLLRTENRAHERVFRALSGTMVGTAVRDRGFRPPEDAALTQQFGLTELRLYATIFMHWISVVLVWLVLTVLRARRDRFTFGVLTMAFAAVILINAQNPDALIVRVNVDHLEAGRSSMPTIITHLSADAALVLVESLSRMSEPDHRIVEEDLHALWANAGGRDWRTWI